MFRQRLPAILFFLSGFSGLVYQIIWLRLAFAAFGIVSPVISVVVSVFMLGLGAGSLLAGSLVRRVCPTRSAALLAYAAAEFFIGIGGWAVPRLFARGESALLFSGQTDSATYLFQSALVISLSLVPFCLAMGMTFPLMMQALRLDRRQPDSFSYLYLANVLGALSGTLLTPVAFVELFGFEHTLYIAIAANWLAAAGSIWLSFQRPTAIGSEELPTTLPNASSARAAASAAFPLAILFCTGLASMGMEVVWTRAFSPVLLTQVYSFSGLLFVYLLSTWIGSAWYRWTRHRACELSTPWLLAALSIAAFGQLLANDARLFVFVDTHTGWNAPWLFLVFWTLAGIVPYCVILGYLTPMLIDSYSSGDPAWAGFAYAVNIAGCILGPLLASYLFMPSFGIQTTGVLLAMPLWALAGISVWSAASTAWTKGALIGGWLIATACGLLAQFDGVSYEELLARTDVTVFRDHTATVVAIPASPPQIAQLMVNGIGITSHTTSTKIMAHLPLATLEQPPKSILVICFGMGTTFRSAMTWGINVTAVELVPSVKSAFAVFFPDSADLLDDPRGEIVIDDGRRFLRRTDKKFDVITIDPPPPVEAAGSSLLYSKDFYTTLKARLNEHGILQQWFPEGDTKSYQAVLRAVVESFPYVRVYRGFDGYGCHMLASLQPIPERSTADLLARMPEAARRDLVEWDPETTLEQVLAQPYAVADLLDPDRVVIITDDRPFNEYYLLRRLAENWNGTYGVSWTVSPRLK
ncbi:spermine/spermidine synthase domain-containing protein [Planctomicrobium piriforme]|uniref:Spermidine synthase n=1 Tax=Planctomicrobium piriforme TaxID=1576369 RepID=A0A1I3EJW7_9PLAN|nr:hypothetical protein [Planctomicrobium piriforme]SFH99274.1 spermidine synthase [Planctomicrobium piriforme]